jgi:hypothetical protein
MKPIKVWISRDRCSNSELLSFHPPFTLHGEWFLRRKGKAHFVLMPPRFQVGIRAGECKAFTLTPAREKGRKSTTPSGGRK